MQLETVTSRAIHAIGYDASRRVLEVIFNTGRIYQFVDVPAEAYEQLRSAGSKGEYFNASIRDTYSYWSYHAPRQHTRRRTRGI
jgi:predicted nucleic acid-binding protein